MEMNNETVKKMVEEVLRDSVKFKTVFGGVMNNKPEYMTHLRGNTLVFKDNPIIKLRGALDNLEANIICVQILAQQQNLNSLCDELEEIIGHVRGIIRAEITGEELKGCKVIGLDSEEIRQHSHHTTKYYGISHFLPSYKQGNIVAKLNLLRTITRRTEICAFEAFFDVNKGVSRPDIIKLLNRLSSVFWIMMCKYIKGMYK